jgi:hypothetical protein
LTWTPGQTGNRTFPVTILTDTIDEPNETVNLTLSNPQNCTIGGSNLEELTIIDDDGAPTVSFSGAPYTHDESGAQTVTVTISGISGQIVSVNYATSNGTATAGSDYTATSGTLQWTTGQTGDRTFSVTIASDVINESDETVNLTLSNPSNCTISGSNPTTLTITDDDSLGFQTRYTPVAIPEGSTAQFEVRLSAQPSSNVNVTVSPVSGGDPDITVQSGANLVFTPVDWDDYQPITLAAAEDDDDDNPWLLQKMMMMITAQPPFVWLRQDYPT